MSAVKIIRFGDRPPAPDIARPDKVIAGDPVTTTHNYFTDSSGAFFSGIWESTRENGAATTANRNSSI